jgi:hypothetical protein
MAASLAGIESPAIQQVALPRGACLHLVATNVTRQRDDAETAGRSLFERQHVVYEEPRRERHDDLLNTRSIEHYQHPMRKFVLILAARLGDNDESCCSFSLSRLRGADFGRELMHALPDHLCLT